MAADPCKSMGVAEQIPESMRAAVYRGVNDVRIEIVPVPRIRSNEILVQVSACGICPTDLKKIQYGTVPPPRIFGHETAGTVVKTGARVTGLKAGDRVALHHHIPCLHCHACRHGAFAQCAQYKRTGITAGFDPAGGGFAEYVRVMPFVFPGIVKIPRKNSFLEGAMLEPVNTVLKAIRRLQLLRGDFVLVAGQGPIGLMFTRLLNLRGFKVIATDLMPRRLKTAASFGACRVILADEKLPDVVRRVTGKQGLDAAVICAPVDAAVQQSLELLNGGSKVLVFAHTRRGTTTPVDLSAVCVDEKDLIGSYSADVLAQRDVAKLVFSRTLDVRHLITHEFRLEQINDAIALAANPRPDSLKVVVRP
jgi:L-iditol 2-dehydrogenase